VVFVFAIGFTLGAGIMAIVREMISLHIKYHNAGKHK